MKTISLALLLMASMAFVMLGCSDNSNSLVSPKEEGVAGPNPGILPKAPPIVHSLTGNGNIWLDGKMAALTVNAHLYADGSVKGELTSVATAYKFHMGGDVVAVSFYDNYVFSIKDVVGSAAVVWWREKFREEMRGQYLAFVFVDKGQGKNDWAGGNTPPYDEVQPLTPDDIATMFPDFFVPIDVGNLTIH